MALRLSTVGRGVLDGKEAEVSERGSVSVEASVGARDVNVGLEIRGVLVGDFVSLGMEVEVELQAYEISINRIGKISFRLIS